MHKTLVLMLHIVPNTDPSRKTKKQKLTNVILYFRVSTNISQNCLNNECTARNAFISLFFLRVIMYIVTIADSCLYMYLILYQKNSITNIVPVVNTML